MNHSILIAVACAAAMLTVRGAFAQEASLGAAPQLAADPASSGLLLRAMPGAHGVLVLGSSDAAWGAVSLPVRLDALGLGDCRLCVSPDVLVPFRTDAEGTAHFGPPAGARDGTLFAQAIVVTPGAEVAGGSGAGLAASGLVRIAVRRAAERLPVFRLQTRAIGRQQLDALLASLSPGAGVAQPQDLVRPGTVGRKAMDMEVEAYPASGGVYIRDAARLWNPDQTPVVPGESEARDLAGQFLAATELLPQPDDHVRMVFSGLTETGVAADTPGASNKTVLDRQVNYDVEITVQRDGRLVRVPVVGGGGNYTVAVGERGEIVGFHGVWRPIVGVASHEEIISKEQAEATFRATARELDLVAVDATLAYYSAPAFETQELLAPVWVVRAKARFSGVEMPIRNTIIAATRFGPSFTEAALEPRRDVTSVGPASAYSAATSWLGTPFGLGGSQANAQGFVNGLSSAGWGIRFNYGNHNAFESDWNRYDDQYVDAVDFAFYTGHANQYGWQLVAPGDTFLHYQEVGSNPEYPGDLYGQNNLEWLIVAACGPHQSTHFRSRGTSNVFDRWRGAFDGLHSFMGYGAVTFDNTSEGRRVIELARSGMPIIDAWFRTAREIQPSTNGWPEPDGNSIIVTAMWADPGNYLTRGEQIWGTGITNYDARVPSQIRMFVYSGT